MVLEGLVMEGSAMEVDMVGGRWVDCVSAGRGWRGIGASLRLVVLGGVEVGCWFVSMGGGSLYCGSIEIVLVSVRLSGVLEVL